MYDQVFDLGEHVPSINFAISLVPDDRPAGGVLICSIRECTVHTHVERNLSASSLLELFHVPVAYATTKDPCVTCAQRAKTSGRAVCAAPLRATARASECPATEPLRSK